MLRPKFKNDYVATIVVAIAGLVGPSALQADSILPVTDVTSVPFSPCFPNVACGEFATQLPSSNGIQGMELHVNAVFPDAGTPTFYFEITGPLGGLSLPAGASIPYSFSLLAESLNPGGTEIVGSSFFPELNLPPVGGIEGNPVGQQSTTTFDGNCAPGPPGPTTTHWCRALQGSGTLVFASGVPSGALIELGAEIDIKTQNATGSPDVSLNGTIDFNPVPEPRHIPLILLATVLALFAGRKLVALCARR